MSKGYIQYVADTILLEKILTIEEGLTKEAGLVDMFRGVASAIQQQVADRVAKEGVTGALMTYLSPVILGRIWPPLGLVATLASAWGLSVGSIMNKILDSLKPKLESGQKVSLDEINSAGKMAAQSEIGEPLSAEAGDDLFYYLRKVEAEGKLTRLVRTAQWRGRSGLGTAWKAAPWLRGSGGILGRVFGAVGRLRGKWLIAGIIIWFVKTVLMGAGLVEGTKAITKVISGDDEEKPGAGLQGREAPLAEEVKVNAPIIPNVSLPSIINHNLKPSPGRGTQYHLNDGSSVWIVPLINESVSDTLIAWSTEIYPQTKGYEDEIESDRSFINLVSILSKGVNPNSPKYMALPKGIHTRKEVVDRFISPIANKINKETK